MQPSITLARIRLHLHRRAVAAWLAVVLSSGAAGYLAAGSRDPAAVAASPPAPAPTTAPAHPSSAGGRLPPNSRGISVPLPDAAPELHVGDRIDLIAAEAPTSLDEPAGASSGARVVAGAVPVVDVRPGAVTVAVQPDLAPAIAAAVSGAAVTVALVPPE